MAEGWISANSVCDGIGFLKSFKPGVK